MKVALAQYSVSAGDFEANLERIEAFVRQAVAGNAADLICLPELATTGFDWELNRSLTARAPEAERHLSRLSRDFEIDICGSFLAGGEAGRCVNRMLYFDRNGELVASYDKIHLFSAFDEHLHVQPGRKAVRAETRFGKIGLSICYDLRFPGLFRRNTVAGARIHILPAAFPKPRLSHWQVLLRARAIENQSFVIGINQCGFEGPREKRHGTEYFGHSMVVDPGGRVIVEAGEEETLLFAEMDSASLETARSVFDSIRDGDPAVD